jgi:hypothetical protein
VDRFVRWLAAEGVAVVLVRAASRDWVVSQPWGVEIAVRDPFGFYTDRVPQEPIVPARKPSWLRRQVALAIFNPDPTVVWARRAARHPAVLAHGQGAELVLASSPPESVHVAAMRLADRLGASLVADLRDGWLDEPTRAAVAWGWRRWFEARLEVGVLRRAGLVLVTSERWKELLVDRLPEVAAKIEVLTNGYPPMAAPSVSAAPAGPLTLVHAGRFSGSRPTQRVGALLQPLRLVGPGAANGRIRLMGALEPEDLDEVEAWAPRLAAVGWALEAEPPVGRVHLLRELAAADGLLLLAVSGAPIPSKLFEYLPSNRPILAVTPKGSAVWALSACLPQVFLVDPSAATDAASVVTAFLDACRSRGRSYALPEEFSEEFLGARFRAALRRLDGRRP